MGAGRKGSPPKRGRKKAGAGRPVYRNTGYGKTLLTQVTPSSMAAESLTQEM